MYGLEVGARYSELGVSQDVLEIQCKVDFELDVRCSWDYQKGSDGYGYMPLELGIQRFS